MYTASIHTARAAALGLALCLTAGTASADPERPAPPAKYPAEAARVHVVLLGDTRCPEIGAACGKDFAGLRATLTAGLGKKADRLTFHDLTAANPATDLAWTAAEVFRHVRDLKLEGNDSVVLFHSGHGVITKKDFPERTHYLGLAAGAVSRWVLHEALRAHKPRALIVLTDCCSTFQPGRQPGAPGGRAAVNATTAEHLFLRAVGEVSITAAEDGKGAFPSFKGDNPGGAGSAFTVALLRLLHDRRTFTTWRELFPELRAATAAASGGRQRARAFAIVEN